uniref:Reverse transcriptase domain-containing protein n=1 Tax=Tanacetum cinerariifolium TaxID=118510 RepID=A0A6L2P1A3_TANCI|nr:hypothetical protein [Tanacetum cinerariifolium]
MKVNVAYVQLVLLVYKVVAVFNKVNAAKSRVTTAGWIKQLEEQDMQSTHKGICPGRKEEEAPLKTREFEASKPSNTRITSPHSTTPLDSTTLLSPDHPLAQTSPAPTRASYYRSIARMAIRTQSTLSQGMSARIAKATALSPSLFRKRYRSSYETPSPSSSSTLTTQKRHRGTLELVEDTVDESLNSNNKREGLKDVGPISEDGGHGLEDEGPSLEERRKRRLHLRRVEETPTPRPQVYATWVDPVDGTVYTDIPVDVPPARVPVQTPPSPEWSFGSLLVSPSSPALPTSSGIKSIRRIEGFQYGVLSGFLNSGNGYGNLVGGCETRGGGDGYEGPEEQHELVLVTQLEMMLKCSRCFDTHSCVYLLKLGKPVLDKLVMMIVHEVERNVKKNGIEDDDYMVKVVESKVDTNPSGQMAVPGQDVIVGLSQQVQTLQTTLHGAELQNQQLRTRVTEIESRDGLRKKSRLRLGMIYQQRNRANPTYILTLISGHADYEGYAKEAMTGIMTKQILRECMKKAQADYDSSLVKPKIDNNVDRFITFTSKHTKSKEENKNFGDKSLASHLPQSCLMLTLEGFPFISVNTKEYHSECSGNYRKDNA